MYSRSLQKQKCEQGPLKLMDLILCAFCFRFKHTLKHLLTQIFEPNVRMIVTIRISQMNRLLVSEKQHLESNMRKVTLILLHYFHAVCFDAFYMHSNVSQGKVYFVGISTSRIFLEHKKNKKI